MTFQLDPLPTAVFVFIVLCWISFAAFFIFKKKPEAEREETVERKRERASIYGIATQGLSYAIAWGVHRPYFTPLFAMSRALEIVLAVLTAALAVGSVWMVVAAARALGKQWSLAARVVEEHKLVTEGPYRIVRHPIYTGMLGMLLATSFATSFWFAIPFVLLAFIIGTLVRVRSEEKLLRETFGPQFDDYARRVPAFIPGLL
jgi:protein-S-isoprenylcysteine O-methyltransferase Ste14